MVLNSKALQRLVILNYKNANNEELVGLALELVEESNGDSSKSTQGFKCSQLCIGGTLKQMQSG